MGLSFMCVLITSFWITEAATTLNDLSIGGNRGGAFDDISTWSITEGPIRHVTMQCYQQYVGSIQINYDGVNGPQNGKARRIGQKTVVEVELDQGELIEGVDAWGDSFVNGIQFITSTGYTDLCGFKDGNFISVRNRELAYISGRAGHIIDKITFYWKDTDKCQENICLNNGTCLNTIQGYLCSCAPGFNGQNCENDVNICQENTCFNNGTCLDTIQGYFCSCPPGYNGLNCENNTYECQEITCLNNGTCLDTIQGYFCSCPPGFNGQNCEKEANSCHENTCLNNGTCLEAIQGYFCSCDPGFNGKNCENDTNECRENTCLNNGTCLDTIQGYFCSCAPGFNGKNCENEEPCDSNHHWCELESPDTSNMTYIELEEKIQKLRKENMIAKNSTAMFKRSKNSAKDYRISSTITGCVLGVFTISILLVVMIYSDFPLLIRHIKSETSQKCNQCLSN